MYKYSKSFIVIIENVNKTKKLRQKITAKHKTIGVECNSYKCV